MTMKHGETGQCSWEQVRRGMLCPVPLPRTFLGTGSSSPWLEQQKTGCRKAEQSQGLPETYFTGCHMRDSQWRRERTTISGCLEGWEGFVLCWSLVETQDRGTEREGTCTFDSTSVLCPPCKGLWLPLPWRQTISHSCWQERKPLLEPPQTQQTAL